MEPLKLRSIALYEDKRAGKVEQLKTSVIIAYCQAFNTHTKTQATHCSNSSLTPWAQWREMSFTYSTTVIYCRLTVNDKSVPSLLLCVVDSCRGNTMDSCLGAQNSLECPASLLFRDNLLGEEKAQNINNLGLNSVCIYHEPQTRTVIWSCLPICVAFEWHHQWIWLLGCQMVPPLTKVTQWKMFYFLISVDIRERKSRYWTDRNKTSTNYTLLAAADGSPDGCLRDTSISLDLHTNLYTAVSLFWSSMHCSEKLDNLSQSLCGLKINHLCPESVHSPQGCPWLPRHGT